MTTRPVSIPPRTVLTVLPAIMIATVAMCGPFLAPHGIRDSVDIPFAGPSGDAWLGTDHLGQDVTSNLLAGGWGLITIAAVIAVGVTACAALLGAAAALRPGIGAVVERIADSVMLVPPILAMLLVMLSWPSSGTFGLVLVATLIGTPYSARVFAAAASSIAASGYVEVAVASGESLPYLLVREVLPNLRPTIAAQLGLRFVEAIYLVSTAAFLQLPASLGQTNWAIMVRENSSGIMLNPWAVIAPAVAIAAVSIGVAFTVRRFDTAGRIR
ncbi:ABC transporter permease subunit [Nocardia sp. NPDC056100]|uniref:ABC transporter permease subunit n=1 Tax=Nocardia sp. NPDC056100 TaxID=3345712 RepID=UPI0035D98C5F